MWGVMVETECFTRSTATASYQGFVLRLNQIPDNWQQIAVRFRRANAIRDGDILLCFEWKYLRFIWAAKAAQNQRWRLVMVPGIGSIF